ncbi:MAG: M56 family metallopeptidase [Acidobacteriota bacterium]
MIETLNEWASLWWAWMSPLTLQVSLLIGLVYLFELVTRRWVWPQLRLVLWLLVLARLLLPPSLSSPWSVTAPIYTETTQLLRAFVYPQDPPAVDPPLDASTAVFPEFRSDGPELSGPRDHSTIQGRDPQPSVLLRADGVPPRPGLTWQSWLLILWAVGLIVFFSLLAASVHRLKKELSGTRRDPELTDIASRAARTAGLRAAPDVRISSSVPTPAVVGVLRPAVLVPKDHASVLRPEDVRNALLHEMCHIKRRDLLVQRAALLLHLLYWFNPLLWVVRRRIRHLTEMSCDARVVRLLRGETDSYRATILRALRPLLDGPMPSRLDQLGLVEWPGRLTDRLNWLTRTVGSRFRVPVAAAVSLVAIALVLPMVPPARGDADGFAILRITTFTPVGNGQSYLEGLDLFIGRPSETMGLWFLGQFTDPEQPRRMQISMQVDNMGPVGLFDGDGDSRVPGDRFVREDRVLRHRTLVYRTEPLGVRGDVTEESLAPEFGSRSLKSLTASRDGITETRTVLIRGDERLADSLGLPDLSEESLRKRYPGPTEMSSEKVQQSFPKVIALMNDQLENLSSMSLVSDYRESVRKAARSLVWEETGPEVTSRAFEYPLAYQETAVIGPGKKYFLTRRGVDVIHRCQEDGGILESYPVGPETLAATHRSFTVDSQGHLVTLLQRPDSFKTLRRGELVRIFESPESYTEIPLAPPVRWPMDLSIDAAGRYYVLRWHATAADVRRMGRELLPPASHSLSVDRYSPGGKLEQSLLLDSFLTDAPAGHTWNWPRPASLAVLGDGRTFILALSNRKEGGARVTSGRLFEVDWRGSILRPVPLEVPAAGPVTLTDVHGLGNILALEWSDYTSIPEGQPSISTLTVKRLQLWQDGANEPLVNIRGIIEAVSGDQALVTRAVAGGPDTPSLFLVTYR